MNRSFIDPWTPAHTLTGVAAGVIGMSFPVYFGLSVLYDVIEMRMEKTSFGQRFFGTQEHENLTNIAGDLLMGSAGYWSARKLTDV